MHKWLYVLEEITRSVCFKYSKGFCFSLKESWKELSNEEDDPPEFTPPPPLPPPRDPHNGKVEPSFFPESDEIIPQMEIRSLG